MPEPKNVKSILNYHLDRKKINEDKKDLMDRMINGVEFIKGGILFRLEAIYSQRYGQEFSDFLAGAIVNELFSNKPPNERGKKFINSNKEIINKEIKRLKENDEIKEALTQAIRVRQIIHLEQGRISALNFDDPIKKLKELGIFMPNKEQPTPEKFIPMAKKFYESVKTNN